MTTIAQVNRQLVSSGLFGRRSERPNLESYGFRVRLENHLLDVRKGRSWRSETVYQGLRARHSVNREVLAGVDEQAYRQYLGLMSGMTYSQQARLTTTVHEMTRTISHFKSLNGRR